MVFRFSGANLITLADIITLSNSRKDIFTADANRKRNEPKLSGWDHVEDSDRPDGEIDEETTGNRSRYQRGDDLG